jgi:hypothetical protein
MDDLFMDELKKEVGDLRVSNIFLALKLKEAESVNLRLMAQSETDKEHYNALVTRLQTAETALKQMQELSTDPKINRTLNRRNKKVI